MGRAGLVIRSAAPPHGHAHLHVTVETVEYLHKAINREAVEGRPADAGDVGLGRASRSGSLGARQVAFPQNPDNLGGKIGFHQFGIGVRQTNVCKGIIGPPHDLEFPIIHCSCSVKRLIRLRIRSISDSGVLIPVFDFF